MIVGADVTHPGNNQDCPSLAGVVATIDRESGHYLASARIQLGKQEHIQHLNEMKDERLEAFLQSNRRLPDHILFYRDGVGESQFGMVFEMEIPLIRVGCISAGKRHNKGIEYAPNITLLVAGKRHHVRSFPVNGPRYPAEAKKKMIENLYSGLVVDTTVTSPMGCDFYLQTHDSALGTARSAHYIVLLNYLLEIEVSATSYP